MPCVCCLHGQICSDTVALTCRFGLYPFQTLHAWAWLTSKNSYNLIITIHFPVTMETTTFDEISEMSSSYQDNINTTVTTDNSTSVSKAVSQAELWCSYTFPIPYNDPCYGFLYKMTTVIGTVISVTGMNFNGLSLLAFKQMSLNAESLFLAKCLAVYDSVHLFSYLNTQSVVCLTWMFGFGYISNTVYIYWDRFWYILFRIAAPMSFWTMCVITVQR